jgi:succinate-acetate transporter protein
MSFATILIPGSGIVAAYKSPEEFNNALGIYLIAWFMVTFFLLWVWARSIWNIDVFGILVILLFFFPFLPPLTNLFVPSTSPYSIAALKKNFTFIALFVFLTLTFGVLAAGAFTGMEHVTIAGGGLGK